MSDALPYASTEKWMLGEFCVQGMLGEGGSGTVYAATSHGREVALKVLRSDLALSERERTRFVEEADRMRRVEHVGLVALLGAGVLSDGRPYICMPRLHGETLASRLARGRMSVETAVAIFDVMARAVGALHREGLIHRDIKPENVFLEEHVSPSAQGQIAGDVEATPRPVVLDLGIARDVNQHESTTTRSGQLRGTPAYMAPERFFGSPATARSDIYELAVTLYMMLVGAMPWDGVQSPSGRLSPRHPSDLGVDLPRELANVVLQALSTRPEVRPEGADAFADAVCAAVSGGAPSARTTASVSVNAHPGLYADTHVARRPRRWILPVATALACAVLFVAVRRVSGPPSPARAAVDPPVPAVATAVALPVAPPVATPPTSDAAPPTRASAEAASSSARPSAGLMLRPPPPVDRSATSAPIGIAPRGVQAGPSPAASSSSTPEGTEKYYLDRK
jgi:serine/threonine-protein kinase